MHILWIEETDATESDISEAMGHSITIRTTLQDIQSELKKKTFSAIILDDHISHGAIIVDALEKESQHIPLLIFSEESPPFNGRLTHSLCHIVPAPFGIEEIESVLKFVYNTHR